MKMISTMAGLFLSVSVLCGQDVAEFRAKIPEVQEWIEFARWSPAREGLLSGPKLLRETTDLIKPLTRVWAKDAVFVEPFGDDNVVRIVRYWRKDDQVLTLTTVVAPSAKAIREYLVKSYATTQAPLKALPKPAARLGLKAGEVCLALRQPQQNVFSRIDLIRGNVLLMVQGEGAVMSRLAQLARGLDNELRTQPGEMIWKNLAQRPKIEVLEPAKHVVTDDMPVPIRISVQNPGQRELHWLWTMSAGGVEKNLLNDYVYTPSEAGKHTVTLKVVNDLGLYDSASFDIEVDRR